MNWFEGIGGRKFALVIFCIIGATVALFLGFCTFVQWSVYTITVLTGYGVINHQSKKLEKGQ